MKCTFSWLTHQEMSEQIVKEDFNKYLLKSLLTIRSGKYILKPSSWRNRFDCSKIFCTHRNKVNINNSLHFPMVTHLHIPLSFWPFGYNLQTFALSVLKDHSAVHHSALRFINILHGIVTNIKIHKRGILHRH